MPQLVKQKTGMADATTDADFDDLQMHFESSLTAVGKLAEDVTKYKGAMLQWATMTNQPSIGDWPELEVIVAQLQEYHAVMKSVAQKITKRNHKLVDYDRHRNTIRSLQANKNRSVSEERSMIRAEEAFQQAQQEYDEWNNLLKQELPILLECQQQIVKPIYAQLLSVQKQFFSRMAAQYSHEKSEKRKRATEIVIDYEGNTRQYYERLNECQMTRIGGLSGQLSAQSSRNPSSLSINGSPHSGSNVQNGYANKPLPQPNIAPKKSIDQMVNEMQLNSTPEPAKAPPIAALKPPQDRHNNVKTSTSKNAVKALYDFAAQQPGDLTFKTGDTIYILEKTDHRNDWWRGRTEDGREGIFPGNYVS